MSVQVPLYPFNGGLTSIKAIGARCNGITDDTVAIQAALDGGVDLFVPPDVVSLIRGLSLSDGSRIEGPGTLKLMDDSNVDAITAPDTAFNVTLKDLTVDVNQSGQTGGPFYGIALVDLPSNPTNSFLLSDVIYANETPTFTAFIGTNRVNRNPAGVIDLTGAVLTTTDQSVNGVKDWQFNQNFQANIFMHGPHPCIDLCAKPFLAKGDASTNNRSGIQGGFDLADSVRNLMPGQESAGAGATAIKLVLGLGKFKIGSGSDVAAGLRWGGAASSNAISLEGGNRQGTSLYLDQNSYANLITVLDHSPQYGSLKDLTIAGPNYNVDNTNYGLPLFPGGNLLTLNGYRPVGGSITGASSLVAATIIDQLRFTAAADYVQGDLIEVGGQVFLVNATQAAATTVNIYPRYVWPFGVGTTAAVHYISGDLLNGSISFWTIENVDFRDSLRHGIANVVQSYVPRLTNLSVLNCQGVGLYLPNIADGTVDTVWAAQNRYGDIFIDGVKLKCSEFQFETVLEGYNLELRGGGIDVVGAGFDEGALGAVLMKDSHGIILDDVHMYRQGKSSISNEWNRNSTYLNGFTIKYRGNAYQAKNVAGNKDKIPTNTTYWTNLGTDVPNDPGYTFPSNVPAIDIQSCKSVTIGAIDPDMTGKAASYMVQVSSDSENVHIAANGVSPIVNGATQYTIGWVNDLSGRALVGHTAVENGQPPVPTYFDAVGLGGGKTVDDVAAQVDALTALLVTSKYGKPFPGIDPTLVAGVTSVFEARLTDTINGGGPDDGDNLASWDDALTSGTRGSFGPGTVPPKWHSGPVDPSAVFSPGQGAGPYIDFLDDPITLVFGADQVVTNTYTIILAGYRQADGALAADHRLWELTGTNAKVVHWQGRFGGDYFQSDASNFNNTGSNPSNPGSFVFAAIITDNGSTRSVSTLRLNGVANTLTMTDIHDTDPTGIKLGSDTAPGATSFKQRITGLVIADGALDFSAGGDGHKIEQWLGFWAGRIIA